MAKSESICSSSSTSIVNSLFRTQYGPKLRVKLEFSSPARTKQEFRDECDINRIMAQYAQTGVLPVDPFKSKEPQYVDCTDLEYQSAMQTVAEAHSLFERLPSAIRDRFENDPGKFLEFAENPDSGPELVKMGLARPVETSPEISGRGVATPMSEEPLEGSSLNVEAVKAETKPLKGGK